MEKENKVIMMRFNRKKDPIKQSVDTLMVRKYMERRDKRTPTLYIFFFIVLPCVQRRLQHPPHVRRRCFFHN